MNQVFYIAGYYILVRNNRREFAKTGKSGLFWFLSMQ